jgi:hypothetical protein
MKRKLLVLSDIHTGSASGLLHPNYVDVDGNGVILNPRQNYLWDNYIRILDAIPRSIDEVIFLGDAIDGKQRASQGEDLTLDLLEDQRLAAIMTLREIQTRIPKASWHFVIGTRYHETPTDVRTVSRYFTDETPEMSLRLRIGNAGILFHHEVGYSSGFLKSANLERETVRGLKAAAEHGWKDYHAQIRAHVHYFRGVFSREHIAISTPCFQMMSPFCLKGSPFSGIPDLGLLILYVDDSRLENGMCPVGFEEFLFRHPEPAAKELEDRSEAVFLETAAADIDSF